MNKETRRIGNKKIRKIYENIKSGDGKGILDKEENSDIQYLQSQKGETLLHLAIEEDEIGIIKLLIKKQADPFIRDEDGMNCMMYAACAENVETLKCLLSFYHEDLMEEDKNEMLVCAVTNNLIENAEYLLGQGFNVNAIFRKDPIIFWATQSGNVNLLKLLVKYGASIHSYGKIKMTPLFLAAAEGMLEVVRWLVSMNAEIDKTDNTGGTPLMLACYFDEIEVVEELIRHKANINAKDDDGISPLLFAIENENVETVDILLKKGADIHCIDNKGEGINEYLLKIESDLIRNEMKSVIRSGAGVG